MCLMFIKFVKKTVKKYTYFVIPTIRRYFRNINYDQKITQPKRCPFGVNITNELQNITTSDNTATTVG
jgi:hypothetical protein